MSEPAGNHLSDHQKGDNQTDQRENISLIIFETIGGINIPQALETDSIQDDELNESDQRIAEKSGSKSNINTLKDPESACKQSFSTITLKNCQNFCSNDQKNLSLGLAYFNKTNPRQFLGPRPLGRAVEPITESVVVSHHLDSLKPYVDLTNDVSLTIVYDSLSITHKIFQKTSLISPSSANTPENKENITQKMIQNTLLPPPEPNPIMSPFYSLYDRSRYYLLGDSSAPREFHRIYNASGVLKPGQTTLILSGPGGGRGTLLKVLALNLPTTHGALFFNGMQIDEAKQSQKCDLNKFVKFIDQTDFHFSNLTVRETIEFAYFSNVRREERQVDFVDNLLLSFDMVECANTLFQSCSGGQKRRVTVILGLCNPYLKLICFKQPTDGLDSALSDRMIFYLKKWAIVNNAHVIIAMQQPSSTIFESFDNLILLKDGYMVYNGPNCDVEAYFTAMGFPCLEDNQLSSHILNVITYPKLVLQEFQLNEQGNKIGKHHEKFSAPGSKESRTIRLSVQIPDFDPTTVNIKHNLTIPSNHQTTASVLQGTNSSESSIAASIADMYQVNNEDPNNCSDETIDFSMPTPTNTRYLMTSLGPVEKSLCPCLTLQEMLQFYSASPMYLYIEETIKKVSELRQEKGLKQIKQKKSKNDCKLHNIFQNSDDSSDDDLDSSDDEKSRTTDASTSTHHTVSNSPSSSPFSHPKHTHHLPFTKISPSSLLTLPSKVEHHTLITTTPQGDNNTFNKPTTVCRDSSPSHSTSLHQQIHSYHLNHLNSLRRKVDRTYITALIENIYQDGLAPLITRNTQKYYSLGYTNSLFDIFKLVINRQINLTCRNKSLIISRLLPAIAQSILFGGMYFQLPLSDYNSRTACIADITTELAYNAFIEVQLELDNREILHSQFSLYPAWIYTVSAQLCALPFAAIESLIFTIIPYFLIGHTPNVLYFLAFWVLLFLHGLVFSALVRFTASFSPNAMVANSIVLPVACMLYFCNGFYIRENTIPQWLVWLIYISPFTWALRSMALVEFSSSRYDYLIPSPQNPALLTRAGEVYLRLAEIYPDKVWILYSVVFCLVVVIILLFLSAYFMHSPFREYTVGTTRWGGTNDSHIEVEYILDSDQSKHFGPYETHNDQANPNIYIHSNGNSHNLPSDSITRTPICINLNNSCNAKSNDARISLRRPLQTLTDELPFMPTSLCFHNISFTVDAIDEKSGKSYRRTLLHNIHGLVQVGTSLMIAGSSGAGKSSLMNLLYGISTTTATQTVGGDIYVNGEKILPSEFAAIAGYVEQFTTLPASETVYECLYFSAKMKLIDVGHDILHKVVLEVLDVLELTHVTHTLCGSLESPTLSPSQSKRVAIGVVLVQNPSILFLDEPTTGLDEQAASIVVRTISRIARSGRATITTIHSPAAQLFYNFDSLLLLGSGGYQLFSASLGRRGKHMIDYFSSLPPITPLPPRINPAEWMIAQVSQTMPPQLYSTAEAMYTDFYTTNPHCSPPFVYEDEESSTQNQFHNEKSNPTSESPRHKFVRFSSLTPKQQFIQYIHISWLTSSMYEKSLQLHSHLISPSFLSDINASNHALSPNSNQIPRNKVQLCQSDNQQQYIITTSALTLITPPEGLILMNSDPSPDNLRHQPNISPQDDISNIHPSNDTHHPTNINQMDQVIPLHTPRLSPNSIATLVRPKTLPFFQQFVAVLLRTWHIFTRDSFLFYSRVVGISYLSIFFAFVYAGLKVDSFNSFLTFQSASTLAAGNLVFIFTMTSLPLMHKMRKMFYREQQSQLYHPMLWPISFLLCEFVLLLPMAWLCMLFHYFAMGAVNTVYAVMTYWAINFIFAFFWINYAVMLSLFCPSPSLAEIIQNVTVSISFVLGGVAIPITKVSKLYKFLIRIFPIYYINRLFMMTQFADNYTIIDIYENNVSRAVSIHDFAAEYVGFEYDQFGWSVLWINVLMVVVLIITTISTMFCRWK